MPSTSTGVVLSPPSATPLLRDPGVSLGGRGAAQDAASAAPSGARGDAPLVDLASPARATGRPLTEATVGSLKRRGTSPAPRRRAAPGPPSRRGRPRPRARRRPPTIPVRARWRRATRGRLFGDVTDGRVRDDRRPRRAARRSSADDAPPVLRPAGCASSCGESFHRHDDGPAEDYASCFGVSLRELRRRRCTFFDLLCVVAGSPGCCSSRRPRPHGSRPPASATHTDPRCGVRSGGVTTRSACSRVAARADRRVTVRAGRL